MINTQPGQTSAPVKNVIRPMQTPAYKQGVAFSQGIPYTLKEQTELKCLARDVIPTAIRILRERRTPRYYEMPENNTSDERITIVEFNFRVEKAISDLE